MRAVGAVRRGQGRQLAPAWRLGQQAACELRHRQATGCPPTLARRLGVSVRVMARAPAALRALRARSQYLARPARVVLYANAIKQTWPRGDLARALCHHLAHELYHHLEAGAAPGAHAGPCLERSRGGSERGLPGNQADAAFSERAAAVFAHALVACEEEGVPACSRCWAWG